MHPLPEPLFEGFSKPEANFFRLPNEWTDITAQVTSLAELKLVEYVLKHTWGYSQFDMVKKITTDEFMHGRKKKSGERLDTGTGLSKPSVIAGLKGAIKHRLSEIYATHTAPKSRRNHSRRRSQKPRRSVRGLVKKAGATRKIQGIIRERGEVGKNRRKAA